MSKPAELHQLEYAAESGWAESSTTFGSRIPIVGGVNYTLTQQKIDAERTVAYLQSGTHHIRGVQSGEISYDEWCPGHGASTASGTPSVDDHETRLGYFLGAAVAGGAATTATGGTATAVSTAAADGLTAGQVIWGGTKGDGRADGQASVVSAHGSSTADLLVGLPAAMNNGDVVASSVMVYPISTASSSSITSARGRYLSANQQYACHGLWPMSLTLAGINPNEQPRWTYRWGVSRFSPVSATFPSAVAVDSFNPAPCTGGSLFVAAKGTATRTSNTYTVRTFELSLTLNNFAQPGPGGVSAVQSIVGAVRGPIKALATFTVDHESATATPIWHDRWDDDNDNWHLLYNFNGAATSYRMALYAPNARIVGDKPIQFNHNGVNSERITFEFHTDESGASELTKSAFRFAFG